MQKIGVIGSGIVGQVLANGFRKHGYDVMLGSNHPGKLQDMLTVLADGITTGSFQETAAFGDILVLAVKGTAAEAVIGALKANLAGKIVIDTTNPISEKPPVNGVLQYFTDMNNESLMECLQHIAPETHFVKAFNSVGNAFMVNPDFGAQRPAMFYCGNNDDAKAKVAVILNQFGFEAEDMGKVEGARAIEPLCILWCLPGFLRNQWTHALAMLKK